eukprot:TRINITY_DN14096_c0_g1_i1.p1 TRINITY_DN14096_c0_g1~~TRINITY_DN14096_c0_g1_i1.p1  ORF type:complete len:290 (+),score=42.97 TRINITY_DN14096_c0_g1_i1:3-872(+)
MQVKVLFLLVLVTVCWGFRAKHIEGYWTRERMESATPMPLVGLDAKEKVKAGENTVGDLDSCWFGGCSYSSELHDDRSTYMTTPFSSIGKVYFSLGVNNYVCSGSYIGNGLVWTAGHCVFDNTNNVNATNFRFVPGLYRDDEIYGSYDAEFICPSAKWMNPPDSGTGLSWDFGLVRLSGVPDTLASVDIAFNVKPAAGEAFTSYGYPAGAPFTGILDNTCYTSWCCDDGNTNIGAGCDSTGGSSGGGWLDSDNTLIGLNSYQYNFQPDVMYSPLFGAEASALYQSGCTA